MTIKEAFFQMYDAICRSYPALDPINIRYYPAVDVINLILDLKAFGKKKTKTENTPNNRVERKRVYPDTANWY